MGRNKNKKGSKATSAKGNTSSAITEVEELKKTMRRGPMKLRFSPTAWAKLMFLRDIGDTEVGGFGITLPDDLLYVDDFILIKQECTSVTVEFDDDDVADFMMDMVEDGLKPEQFMRIWIHTHPNMSADPSGTDENTFDRVFGKCDWAVMAIVSKTGDQYCRLQINGGPFPGAFEIPMEVDFSTYDFEASDTEAWLDEHIQSVTELAFVSNYGNYFPGGKYTRTYKGPHNTNDSKQTDFASAKSEIIHPADDIELLQDYTEDLDGFVFTEQDIGLYMSIPDEVLKYISPNEMSLLESMNPYEREYVLDDIKKRIGFGD